jgi:hypothetical protein
MKSVWKEVSLSPLQKTSSHFRKFDLHFESGFPLLSFIVLLIRIGLQSTYSIWPFQTPCQFADCTRATSTNLQIKCWEEGLLLVVVVYVLAVMYSVAKFPQLVRSRSFQTTSTLFRFPTFFRAFTRHIFHMPASFF